MGLTDWIPLYWIYEDLRYWWEYKKGRRSDYELLLEVLGNIKSRMRSGNSSQDIFIDLIRTYYDEKDRFYHLSAGPNRMDVIIGYWHGFVTLNSRNKYIELVAYVGPD